MRGRFFRSFPRNRSQLKRDWRTVASEGACAPALDKIKAFTQSSLVFPYAVTTGQVEDALARVGPEAEVVLLVDSSTAEFTAPNVIRISVETDSPESLEAFQSHVVVVATFHHDLVEPFIEKAHANGIRYLSVYDSVPKGYLASNALAIKALESEFQLQSSQGWDKWDYGPGDFVNLIQFIERTRHLSGSILEIGTYMGSSAGVMLRYLSGAGIKKRLDLIDVFDGFNYADALTSSDAHWAGTHTTDGMEPVASRLLQSRFPDAPKPDFKLHRLNIVTDDLPSSIVEGGLCLVNLDVDLYEAVQAGIEKVHHHLVPGGVLVVEDAGHTPLLTGARVALSEFLATPAAQRFTAIEMESGQVLLVRLS